MAKKLTTEDKIIWKAVIRDVKKSKSTPEFELDSFFLAQSNKVKITPKIDFAPKPKRPMRKKDLVEGEINYMDGSNFEKLKAGKIAISSRIDLHGYRVDEARLVTYEFIRKSYDSNKRCILIITGKSGKIKQEFSLWLNLPEIADMILSFTTAQPKHGGSGAYYLMLKKRA